MTRAELVIDSGYTAFRRLSPSSNDKFDFFAVSCNNNCYMIRNGKLSDALHVLLHMAQQDEPLTSERLGQALDTNPVVIRRIMAGLREHGYVRSEKGHGGGWTLACDLAQVTLRDIHAALGKPKLLAVGQRTESPKCLVEQAVNEALGQTCAEAEALLLSRLGEITLATLSADIFTRCAAGGGRHHLASVHRQRKAGR